MKRLSKVLAAVLSAVLVAGILFVPTKAEAADSKTYTVRYGGTGWAFEYESGKWMGVGSLDDYLKDGDNIVVDAAGGAPGNVQLTLTKKVGQFAADGVTVVVAAPSVQVLYAVNGGTVVLNGNADTVYVTPGNVVQVNGNAGYVEGSYADGAKTVFAVTGTVAHFKGRVSDYETSPAEVYDIPAGKCKSDGDLSFVWLEKGTMKTTPSTTVATTTTVKKELDEVPKTGLSLRGTLICVSISAVLALMAVMFSGNKREELN